MDHNFVKMLVDRFLIERKKNDRGGIYALTQRMLAYNSNKIEGSTLSIKQTASLFETGTLIADGDEIRAKDVEETMGHFLLFNTMLDTFEKPLSHELIKLYHLKLKSGVWEDLANGYPVGEYKNRMNIVSDITTALPSEVEEMMSKLLDNYNNKITHTLEDVAMFHADFEKIHPFQDGNGRTGRMIIFKECLKNDLIPLIILDDNKRRYYNVLNRAQTEMDYSALNDFLKVEQAEYFKASKSFVIPMQTNDKLKKQKK